MLPGNPGISQLYMQFAAALLQRVPGLAIVVPSLAGFRVLVDPSNAQPLQVPAGTISNGPYLLQDQVDFVTHFVRAVAVPLAEAYRLPPSAVWVAGHSIGGYFATHVLARFPDVIGRALLLAPTIGRMRESDNGLRLTPLLTSRLACTLAARGVMGTLHRFLPQRVLETLAYYAEPGLRGSELAVATEISRPDIFFQLTSLAGAEMVEVDAFDTGLLRAYASRLHFMFAQVDGWVPAWIRDELRTVVPDAAVFKVMEDKKVTHTWCLNAPDAVAAFCAEQMFR
jgi:pimeloyl-ACP methyl ester carboxylesterase